MGLAAGSISALGHRDLGQLVQGLDHQGPDRVIQGLAHRDLVTGGSGSGSSGSGSVAQAVQGLDHRLCADGLESVHTL